MSAEVPKLHCHLPLGDPGSFGDRPPAQVVVVLADPAVLLPHPSLSPIAPELPIDDRSMAFPAEHRFEYV
jgi:hypothetical protein